MRKSSIVDYLNFSSKGIEQIQKELSDLPSKHPKYEGFFIDVEHLDEGGDSMGHAVMAFRKKKTNV